MISNIVFDMGNVLIPFDPTIYLDAFVDNDSDKALLRKEVFQSLEWVGMDTGKYSPDQATTQLCARLPQHVHSMVENLVKHWPDLIEPYTDMEQLVAVLKSGGYSAYLLSNTSRQYHNFKSNIPAVALMDGEFASTDWGIIKPHHEIYKKFCAHFSLKPEECFFIDDNPINVQGAIDIGMEGFVYLGDMENLKNALRSANITVA